MSNITGNDSTQEILYHVPGEIIAILALFYGAISLVAILGNSFVIWVISTNRRMQSVTNFFIANLASADIIIGLFSIPFQFQAALLQRWVLPKFMCKVAPFVQVLSVNVSIFTLTAIAVDRYRALMYPLKPRMTKLTAKIVIASIWIASCASAVPTAVALRVIKIPDKKHGGFKDFCFFPDMSPQAWKAYNMFLIAIQYYGPLLIITFAYFKIGYRLWGSKTPGNAQDQRDETITKNKKKVIKMLLMVVALFVLCWLPLQSYHLLQEIFPINEYKYINIVWFCSHWLAMSNSCYNPFIYGVYNEKFRREFARKFRRCFCIRRRSSGSPSKSQDDFEQTSNTEKTAAS